MRAVIEQLRVELAAQRETPKSMARRMGRSYATVRRYFAGERALPLDDLISMLDLLEVPWEKFARDFTFRMRGELGPLDETEKVATASAAPGLPDSPSSGVAQDLLLLSELRDRGALTDDEFTRAKARVLA